MFEKQKGPTSEDLAVAIVKAEKLVREATELKAKLLAIQKETGYDYRKWHYRAY